MGTDEEPDVTFEVSSVPKHRFPWVLSHPLTQPPQISWFFSILCPYFIPFYLLRQQCFPTSCIGLLELLKTFQRISLITWVNVDALALSSPEALVVSSLAAPRILSGSFAAPAEGLCTNPNIPGCSFPSPISFVTQDSSLCRWHGWHHVWGHFEVSHFTPILWDVLHGHLCTVTFVGGSGFS